MSAAGIVLKGARPALTVRQAVLVQNVTNFRRC